MTDDLEPRTFSGVADAWRLAQWRCPTTQASWLNKQQGWVATCGTCFNHGVTPASWEQPSEAAVNRWVKSHWAWHQHAPIPVTESDQP